MFIMFVLLMKYDLVGNIYHELLGILLFVLFIIHNLFNLKWIKSISKMILVKKLKSDIVIKYILDLLLWISLILVMLSGVLISKYLFTFNIDFSLWGSIHKISSFIFLFIMLIHTLLHLDLISGYISSKLHINKNVVKAIIVTIILIISILCLKDLIPKKEVNVNSSTTSSPTDSNTNTSNPPVTLLEYLSGLHCSNCQNRCILSAIRCSRGETPKEEATSNYYQLYSDETSYNSAITETLDGVTYTVGNI